MKRTRSTKPSRKHAPSCPMCSSSDVVPIFHGVVTPERQRMLDAGTAILSDREEWEGITEWYCKSCGCDWSKTQRRFKIPGGVNATRG